MLNGKNIYYSYFCPFWKSHFVCIFFQTWLIWIFFIFLFSYFCKGILSNFYVYVPHLLYLNNICIINTFVTFIFSTTLNFILSFGSFFLILELLKKILISSFIQLSFFSSVLLLTYSTSISYWELFYSFKLQCFKTFLCFIVCLYNF